MPRNYTIDEKIQDFEVAVRRHILDAAKILLDHDAGLDLGAVRLLAVYFEVIAKYMDGFSQLGQSREYFVRGCREVIERLPEPRRRRAQHIRDDPLEGFYELVRCGLAHGAVPPFNVTFGGSMTALTISEDGRQLNIDARSLLNVLSRDLYLYLDRLRDERENQLRENFERRWNFEADCPH